MKASLTMPFGFYPADSEEGRRLLHEAGEDGSRLPVVIRQDGRVLVEPSDADIAEAVGGSTRTDIEGCDLVIVGAGPAGLAAAVYAASEGLETVVVERRVSGGQAGTSSRIRNFPGFTWGIRGQDFAYRMHAGKPLDSPKRTGTCTSIFIRFTLNDLSWLWNV